MGILDYKKNKLSTAKVTTTSKKVNNEAKIEKVETTNENLEDTLHQLNEEDTNPHQLNEEDTNPLAPIVPSVDINNTNQIPLIPQNEDGDLEKKVNEIKDEIDAAEKQMDEVEEKISKAAKDLQEKSPETFEKMFGYIWNGINYNN